MNVAAYCSLFIPVAFGLAFWARPFRFAPQQVGRQKDAQQHLSHVHDGERMIQHAMIQRVLLYCLFLICTVCRAAQISWIADSINYNTYLKSITSNSTALLVNVTTNGLLYQNNNGGHYKLHIDLRLRSLAFYVQTDCLYAWESADYLTNVIQNADITHTVNQLSLGQSLKDYFDISGLKFEKGVSKHISTYTITMTQRQGKNMTPFNVSLSTTGCRRLRTLSAWSNAQRWSGSVVPTAADDVVLPTGTGVLDLVTSPTVKSLTLYDAYLLAQHTQCPTSWTSSSKGNKCYKLFESALDFYQAENFCNTLTIDGGQGSVDRHLVHVKDRQELVETYGLCRGSDSSLAKADGCWIGLYDQTGEGDFNYIVPEAVGGPGIGGSAVSSLFLDWRRYEPNNHTVSRNNETLGGERCVATFPGQEDPLLLEEGGYVDDNCYYARPFLCQVFKTTSRVNLTVTGALTAYGGLLIGGGMVVKGEGTVGNFSLSSTALLSLSAPTTIGTVRVEDLSTLSSSALLSLSADSFIGERGVGGGVVGGQSLLLLSPNSTLQLQCGAASVCVAEVNARVEGRGAISLGPGAQLLFKQGGEVSQASLSTASVSSSLLLDGYATRLSSYDAFELSSSNRGPYQGEYRGADNTTAELLPTPQGVYRLQAVSFNSTSTSSGSADVEVEDTECIPYTSSAEQLASLLNQLPSIARRGGVVVRRYGDALSSLFHFGYTYRVELNRIDTPLFSLGPLLLQVACYGQSCGCAETLVPLKDESGTYSCLHLRNTSLTQPMGCNFPPTLTLSRLSSLSFVNTTGTGTIVVRGGRHRLPPVSSITISAQGNGTGVVAGDAMRWQGLDVKDTGQLIITGTGWEGWDHAKYLYAPAWTDERGELESPAPCVFSAHTFSIGDRGGVFVSSPNSSLYWDRGVWAGGSIGGMAYLSISQQILLNGTGKALRYALAMEILPGGQALWLGGNLTLSNGASIAVRGNFTIKNSPLSSPYSPYPMAIGEAEYMSSLSDPPSLQSIEGGRSFQSYYSSSLPPLLRPAWYPNPLCSPRCNNTNLLTFLERGVLEAAPASGVRFNLPVHLLGTSLLVVGERANVTLAGGGVCGNDVIVSLSPLTTLSLSGGQMEMQATCTIRGSGELIVDAGEHYVAFSIDAHITIRGGSLLWPLSRGTQKTLTFNGGLLLEGTGRLEVQPFSTTILVHQEVELTDQALVQFPLIGIAAQGGPFDAPDAPDTSPRGNFTATDGMTWTGGTIKGKADFNILTQLLLGGESKYITSLAKLVNRGHCEWSGGQVVTSDQGDFQNFGSLQTREASVGGYAAEQDSVQAYYTVGEKGEERLFNSYESELGGVEDGEYLQLTAEVVSRVPTGWTPADQGE